MRPMGSYELHCRRKCGTKVLWDTPESFGTLLERTLIVTIVGDLLLDTPATHSYATAATVLSYTLVGHFYMTVLKDTLVRSCGTLWCNTLLQRSESVRVGQALLEHALTETLLEAVFFHSFLLCSRAPL